MELNLNPSNPRTIKKEQFEKLKKSIKEFPQMLDIRPIIYDETDTILGGNMRYRALQELEKEGLEIKDSWFKNVKDLTEEQKKEFVIKDNVPFGDWDYDVLANEWSDLPLDDWGIDTTKWDNNEVVEDEPPEVSDEEPVSKYGEVYQLGRPRLMCGDSTKLEDVELLMGGGMADMVFTDPPYNVDYGSRKILNDSFTSSEKFREFLIDMLENIRVFVKGDVYIAMSSSELHTLHDAFTSVGGHWSTFIIWVKNNFTMGRSNYQRQYEPILYGWFDKTSHYWAGARNLGDVIKREDSILDGDGKVWLNADNLSMDVWEFDKPGRSKEHPTMKPIKLCARAISNSSKLKNVVLDVFAGSGSTLIACEQLNRNCYAMELDPKYCDVIRKRYAKFIDKEDEWQTITAII